MTCRSAVPKRVAANIAACVLAMSSVQPVLAQAGVQLHSVGPAPMYPATLAVQALVSYGISVDCSPARACYAKSQWIHAYVHCWTRTVATVERVSMDLNGDVIATHKPDVLQFQHPLTDAGNAALLNLLCGPPRERDEWWERYRRTQ